MTSEAIRVTSSIFIARFSRDTIINVQLRRIIIYSVMVFDSEASYKYKTRKFFFPINTVVALGSRNADEFFDRTIIATVGNESIFLSENQIE